MSEHGADSVEQLLAAGRYAEAAAELRRLGRLKEAQATYERIWDFRAAADVARERGDRPELLRLLLETHESTEAGRVSDALRSAAPEEQRRGAQIFEGKRLWAEAAWLREALGELAEARQLYLRAQMPLEAARLDEVLGDERAAGLLYERVLAEGARSADAPRAHLALGRLLLRFARFEDGVRHLQRAARLGDDGTAPRARRLLVGGLWSLGFRDAAEQLLAKLRIAEPRLPELEAFVAGEEMARPAGARLGGRYSAVRLLGSGGVGRVYLARDELSGRDVAVKVVAPPLDERGHTGYARFVREARIISSLEHPHIVGVIDFHEREGLLAMEYMSGGTLADRLGEALSPARVRRLLYEITGGLEAAHGRSVIHRDLKPANIFFSAAGEAKLGDFGVAHLQDLGATQTAGFIGTLAYMSPEQISGAPLTFACDIYALGVTTFQALTGRLPFSGPDFVSQHLGEIAAPPSSLRPGLERAWDSIVARMLEKDPSARFASIAALRRALEATGSGDELAGRPEPAPDVPAAPARQLSPRYQLQAPLPPTAVTRLELALDLTLGREVCLEQLDAAYATGSDGQAHLRWLRAIARLGGPQLQRILRLQAGSDGGITAVFESLGGAHVVDGSALSRRHAEELLALLRPLHAEGVAHGAVESSLLALDDGGVVLLVAGRRPSGRSVSDEKQRLEALLA